jgi:hypothetical protein
MWINLHPDQLENISKLLHSNDDPALAAYIQERLTEARNPGLNALKEAARDLYGTDDVEIDDQSDGTTTVSEGNGGTWVLGWLWVPEEFDDT